MNRTLPPAGRREWIGLAVLAIACVLYAMDLTVLHLAVPVMALLLALGPRVLPEFRSLERRFTAWPEWAITTRIETSAYWRRVWQAVACHRTQIPNLPTLHALPAAVHARLWAKQTFYRAMSLVNGGREVEDDRFAGLRERH